MRKGFCLFAFVLLVCAFDLSLAGVINVPADQPTIQDGIDAATIGDTVLIADGTYTGTGNRDLDFGGKAIVVTSVNGAGATTIDCEESGRGFIFNNGEGPGSILKGLAVLHAYADTGAGIYINAASPTIGNCVLQQHDGLLRWEQSLVTGGGAVCLNGSQAIFTNCSFRYNTGMHGAALYITDESDVTFNGCVVEGNSITYPWVAAATVYIENASPQFSDCLFSHNYIDDINFEIYGSAGVMALQTDAVFSRCIFNGNANSNPYGLGASGMVLSGGSPTVEQCTFFDNADVLGGSFGTYASCISSYDAASTIRYNIFAYNNQEAKSMGPVINWDADQTLPVIECNVFFENGEEGLSGPIAAQVGANGNAYVAPRFCDTASASVDLHPASGSYCAPDINSCGVLIGALPIDSGCDIGCCTGYRGNVDGDPLDVVDISDIAALIQFQFVVPGPVPCLEEADLDLSGDIDITDLSLLIDNQFLTLTPLPACR